MVGYMQRIQPPIGGIGESLGGLKTAGKPFPARRWEAIFLPLSHPAMLLRFITRPSGMALPAIGWLGPKPRFTILERRSHRPV